MSLIEAVCLDLNLGCFNMRHHCDSPASLSANIGIFIKTAKSIIFHFVVSFLSGHDLLIDDFVSSTSSITVPQLSS